MNKTNEILKKYNRILKNLTGFFFVVGVISFFYSLIRGGEINIEAIYLTVVMLTGYIYFKKIYNIRE
ncbi:hypothetical protein D1864_08255 [Oceanobacillus picturae]|nr:hypothetical protein D1864_08255 [Oceanobacillus picturae]